MNLNFIEDASVSKALAAFVDGLNYVATTFDKLITNDITVNIEVGYGGLGGTAVDASDLGKATQTRSGYPTPHDT